MARIAPFPKPSLVQWLGWATLIGFGAGGVAIMVLLQERDPVEVMLGSASIPQQMTWGVAAGLLTGFIAWWVVKRRFMSAVLHRYASLVGPLMGARRDRIFVSLCAGIGEELFFRGAIQHWLGILITAILFVALHGYLDPRSWRVSLYGVFMTMAMIGLGWLAERFGLIAPIVAHTLIDIVLLEKLYATWSRSASDPPEDTPS